ncbi:MAG: InlB B-repeat-containing protein, partial [Eggerthellaceae bacterium]|nr:InlB B-repeat-containing protein [Eggerthellaceae bacterium]
MITLHRANECIARSVVSKIIYVVFSGILIFSLLSSQSVLKALASESPSDGDAAQTQSDVQTTNVNEQSLLASSIGSPTSASSEVSAISTQQAASEFVEADPDADTTTDAKNAVPDYYTKLLITDPTHLDAGTTVADDNIAADQHYTLYYYTIDGKRVYRVYGTVSGSNIGYYAYDVVSDTVDTSKVLDQSQEQQTAQTSSEMVLNTQDSSSIQNVQSDATASLSLSPSALSKALPLNAATAGNSKIINGNFEAFPSTLIDRSSYIWGEVQRSTSKYRLHGVAGHPEDSMSQSQLDDFAWSTTENSGNGWVELQKDSLLDNVFAELCAYDAGTAIYQDIISVPGSVLKWKLKHSSRKNSYTDGMSVLIGEPGAETAQLARRTSTTGASMNANVTNGDTNKINWENVVIYTPNQRTDNSGFLPSWESYEGTYEVPDGQTSTRFTFRSVDVSSAGSGNYLDDIEFAQAFPLWYKANGGQRASGVVGDTVDSSGAPYTGKRSSNSVYASYYLENVTPTLATAVDDSATGDTWDSSMMKYPDDADGRGHDFVGWSKSQHAPLTSKDQLDRAGVITEYSSIATSEKGNTVYAVWGAKPTATFHSQVAAINDPSAQKNIAWGGTVSEPSGWTIGSTTIRPGYTFKGWCTDAACTQDYGLTSALYSDIDLYAKWSANSYDVAFNANSGNGNMPNQTFVYDADQALQANTFTRTNYVFMRWNTAADGTGTSYADKQAVKNLTQSGTVTLYAQWESVSNLYKIDAQSVTLTSADAKAAFSGAADATVLEGDTYNKVNAQKRATPNDAWGPATASQTIDANNWTSIKAGTIGIYKVTYTNTEDPGTPKVSITVAVTIVSDSTVVSANQRFSIDAQSITLKSTDARAAFAGATDATVLKGAAYNKVSAQKRASAIDSWSSATAAQTIVVDDWNKIKAGTEGTYQVTYVNSEDTSTPKVSKTVAVTIVSDESVVSGDQLFRIDAQSVTLTSADAIAAFAG